MRLTSAKNATRRLGEMVSKKINKTAKTPVDALSSILRRRGWTVEQRGEGIRLDHAQDIRKLTRAEAVVSSEELDRIRAGNPKALMSMLDDPEMAVLLVGEVKTRKDGVEELVIDSSVAEVAMREHGDEAVKAVLANAQLRDTRAVEPLSWSIENIGPLSGQPPGWQRTQEGLGKVAGGWIGVAGDTLAFRALYYMRDLRMALEYPQLWDTTPPINNPEPGSWLWRATVLADIKGHDQLATAVMNDEAARDHPIPAGKETVPLARAMARGNMFTTTLLDAVMADRSIGDIQLGTWPLKAYLVYNLRHTIPERHPSWAHDILAGEGAKFPLAPERKAQGTLKERLAYLAVPEDELLGRAGGWINTGKLSETLGEYVRVARQVAGHTKAAQSAQGIGDLCQAVKELHTKAAALQQIEDVVKTQREALTRQAGDALTQEEKREASAELGKVVAVLETLATLPASIVESLSESLDEQEPKWSEKIEADRRRQKMSAGKGW